MNDPELQEFVGAHKPHDENEILETPAFKRAGAFFDFVELATFTIVIILLVSCFFFRHTVVNGGSMEQTLTNGEHLIISDFMYTPKNGDIIVFEVLNTPGTPSYIKRVIATAGQTVAIREGVVYLDGTALDESEYLFYDVPSIEYIEYPETEVPEGYVFVLGDHRNDSTDSRYSTVGMVDIRSILGRVVLRITPFQRFGAVD